MDDNLITSRKPDDIPAFDREMIKMFDKSHTSKRESRTAAAKMQRQQQNRTN